jgi:Uncharacterized protein conserved in bacteria (DUF2188)
MATITYHIVQHDGGWAYKLGDVYSETHATHDEAMAAARAAARRQDLPGRTGDIMFQDKDGKWHTELADGDHHPHAEVTD